MKSTGHTFSSTLTEICGLFALQERHAHSHFGIVAPFDFGRAESETRRVLHAALSTGPVIALFSYETPIYFSVDGANWYDTGEYHSKATQATRNRFIRVIEAHNRSLVHAAACIIGIENAIQFSLTVWFEGANGRTEHYATRELAEAEAERCRAHMKNEGNARKLNISIKETVK